MIIKHLNENVDRDELQAAIDDIRSIENDIRKIERELSVTFSYVRLDLLSPEEADRYREISKKAEELWKEACRLRSQFEVRNSYRKGDDVEFETEVLDADLKKELEPKVVELEHEVYDLMSEMNKFKNRMHELDKIDIENRRAQAGYEQKKSDLEAKKLAKKDIDSKLIKKYQFDAAAEAIEQMLKATFDDVSIVSISCYVPESDKSQIAALVRYEARITDLDPDDFDGYDEYSRYQHIEISDEFIESIEDTINEDLSDILEIDEDLEFELSLDNMDYKDKTRVKADFEQRTYDYPGGWYTDISGSVNFNISISVELLD